MLIEALMIGFVLGGFFFAGLWWTVRQGVRIKQPALLFLVSMLVRVGAVVAGFYWVAQGDYQRLVACLLGFVFARWIATRVTRQKEILYNQGEG